VPCCVVLVHLFAVTQPLASPADLSVSVSVSVSGSHTGDSSSIVDFNGHPMARSLEFAAFSFTMFALDSTVQSLR